MLPDGSKKAGVKGATTPLDIAREISAGFAKKVVVADVDGAEWDLNRPLTASCALKLFGTGDTEGMHVRRPRLAFLCVPM